MEIKLKLKKIFNIMACGCKNKTANTGGVVKTTPTSSQEAKPQKPSSGRIIKREIR